VNKNAKHPQPVPSSYYDREYFTSVNEGFKEWRESFGKKLSLRHQAVMKRVQIQPGERVLDYGCGRGEITIQCALQGCEKAIGVDYSKDALLCARESLKYLKSEMSQSNVEFMHLSAKKLPFPNECFDKCLMIDVIAHLTPPELDTILPEFFRVLKKSGQLIIESGANRTYLEDFYRYSYAISKGVDFIFKVFRKKAFYNLPKDPWSPSDRILRVNEQTASSLKACLRKSGFMSSSVTCQEDWSDRWRHDWKYTLSSLFIRPAIWPLSSCFANEIWAVAHKDACESR